MPFFRFRTIIIALIVITVLSANRVLAIELLVSSENSDQVLRYNSTTGAFIDEFVSGGGLDNPEGLVIGPDGNLYVSSQNTHEVLRYDATTGVFIDIFVSAGSDGVVSPQGIVFGPDGDLYVSWHQGPDPNEVLRYDSDGASDKFTSEGKLNLLNGLVFGPDGNLYVSSLSTNNILRYNGTTGDFIDTFASGDGLDTPLGLTFGPDGNLYVSSSATDQVLRYNGTTSATPGAFIDVFASGGGLDNPEGLVFGPDGNLYVSSHDSDAVLRYNGTTGAFIDIFASGNGLDAPTFLIFASTAISVTIDIKPGSDPNCFNNNGHGVIPVAILGSADFDVDNIDPETVALESLVVRVVGRNDKIQAHIEDSNGDGINDLVVQIEDVDGVFTPGDGTATLTGELFDGTLFEGSDSICIVP